MGFRWPGSEARWCQLWRGASSLSRPRAALCCPDGQIATWDWNRGFSWVDRFYRINLVSIRSSIESRTSTDKSLLYWPTVFALLRKAPVGRVHLVCRMLARLSHSAMGRRKQEAAKCPAKFLRKPGLKPTTGHAAPGTPVLPLSAF